MYKSVNIIINTDKKTKLSDVFDFTFNNGTNRIFLGDNFPWILHGLFNSQRNSPVIRFQIKDNRFYNFTDSYHLGRMTYLSCPGHF